jgi:hypothetical protein
MSSQKLTRDEIKRAQELVVRIQGISSCLIVTDEEGIITEIHVVATVDKSPTLIARDVESCLKAEMGLDVDHRIIGVVMFDSAPPIAPEVPEPKIPTIQPEPTPLEPETPPAVRDERAMAEEPVAEFPLEEYGARFAFHSVNLFFSQDETRAEVELSLESETVFGSARIEGPSRPPFHLIAEATLLAVSEFLDGSTKLCLGGVRRVALDDTLAIVVIVDLVEGRDRKSLAGASLITDNENQTVVFATLDAVNRVLGKLEFKNTIEYKIK